MKIRVNQWRDYLGAFSAGVVVVLFCLILLWHNPARFLERRLRIVGAACLCGHGPQLVGRALADPEPLFVGMRQSSGRISVRDIFAVCECGRGFGVEISARLSTTGGCTFNCAPIRACGWRIFAWTRSRFFNRFVDLCRADRLVKRLDNLLGSDRLVRCSRGFYMVALGVVGGGTCAEFAKIELAISLAGAVRLPARDRRFSLHGFNAASSHCMAVYQITGPNSQRFLDSAATHWRGARFRPFRARMAGSSCSGSGFRSRVAIVRSALAVARSARSPTGTDFAVVDSELD